MRRRQIKRLLFSRSHSQQYGCRSAYPPLCLVVNEPIGDRSESYPNWITNPLSQQTRYDGTTAANQTSPFSRSHSHQYGCRSAYPPLCLVVNEPIGDRSESYPNWITNPLSQQTRYDGTTAANQTSPFSRFTAEHSPIIREQLLN